MSAKLAPTLESTLGPYFPAPFVDQNRSDLTRVHAGLCVGARGERIMLRGRLLDAQEQLIESALLELWQADGEGFLRSPDNAGDGRLDPWFEGLARLWSDDGNFELATIKPGALPAERPGEAPRAPHLTLTVFCDGITRLVTQLFFAGEPGNEADPLLLSLPPELRPRLIARRQPAGISDSAVYQIDVVLSGACETPFFDDLGS
jgi:protocatechuate 3,4-dioxygenase, alpha subunit